MHKETDIITIEEVLKNARKYITSKKELGIIKKSYELAYERHIGQKRLCGEDFINHPLSVAFILTNIKADYITLSSAIVHETDFSYGELKELLNEDIAHITTEVKKINKLSLSADSEYLIKYYKKILVGLCEDVRVIIIKLADRLHNMRTLWALPLDSQKEKAKETLEILAPIAHKIGINYLKSELEDLSLRYYKPDIYNDILRNLNNTKSERDNSILEMKEFISDILKKHGIKHEIKGRSKSIFSIYNKLNNGKRFNEIYDILALRVYVETEAECYLSLGLIHSKFKPLSKRFKDYIAMPKQNMYQSLHTTIFGIDGQLFEIQIRTYEMDQIAEYGVASHWAYKENNDSVVARKNEMDQKLQIFRNIIESNNDIDSNDEDFVKSVRNEVLNEEIYVYTPKGDVIELPIGATPIDFAYKVHTDVGDKMVGALVNDNIVPLDYELKDGDIVKVNVNKNSKGPNKEWVNIVKTSQAKNRIKTFYTKIDKEINVKKGQELFDKELRKLKIPFSEFNTEKNIKYILETVNEETLDDVYLCIANNKYTANYVINLLYKETKSKEEIIIDKITTTASKIENNKADIIVDGIDGIKISLASCCKPVKGDEIVGYITKTKGITVHRNICPNISKIEERNIEILWNNNIINKYSTNIIIKVEKKENALLSLISKASTSNVNIQTINTINNMDYITYDLIIMVENIDVLNKFIKDTHQMQEVIEVERIIK